MYGGIRALFFFNRPVQRSAVTGDAEGDAIEETWQLFGITGDGEQILAGLGDVWRTHVALGVCLKFLLADLGREKQQFDTTEWLA